MQEAALTRSPAQIRSLFAILLATCGLGNPLALWNEHKDSMTEDYLHLARSNDPGLDIALNQTRNADILYNETLIALQQKVLAMNAIH